MARRDHVFYTSVLFHSVTVRVKTGLLRVSVPDKNELKPQSSETTEKQLRSQKYLLNKCR